jgi:hypothetical protein
MEHERVGLTALDASHESEYEITGTIVLSTKCRSPEWIDRFTIVRIPLVWQYRPSRQEVCLDASQCHGRDIK